MKPEIQKAKSESQKEEYTALGIPDVWVDPLKKLGFTSVAKLKEVKKAAKLANDLNGFNKKNKVRDGTSTALNMAANNGRHATRHPPPAAQNPMAADIGRHATLSFVPQGDDGV